MLSPYVRWLLKLVFCPLTRSAADLAPDLDLITQNVIKLTFNRHFLETCSLESSIPIFNLYIPATANPKENQSLKL